MKSEKGRNSFTVAVMQLPVQISAPLMAISERDKASIHEVRLRVNRPLSVCIGSDCYFVSANGSVNKNLDNSYIIKRTDISDAVKSLCSYSIHTHFEEMRQGYIALRGGSRAGICGTAVTEGGRVASITDVTSINLRIAREIVGCSKKFADMLITGSNTNGLLIVGAPGSGKTTILRDISRMLAGGELGHFYKVAVVDERGEIGAVSGGEVECDIGVCADLLFGYPKDVGMTYAVRSMSPQFVLCDEIATESELSSILYALNSGVSVVTTVHAASMRELIDRRIGKELISSGAFRWIVLLGAATKPCEIKKAYTIEEVLQCGF